VADAGMGKSRLLCEFRKAMAKEEVTFMEGKRDQTPQALTCIVIKGAEIQPPILAVEDLHWIDRSSEKALKDLLEHTAEAKVLLNFTYRTRVRPHLGDPLLSKPGHLEPAPTGKR
jgi:predicted ATPase